MTQQGLGAIALPDGRTLFRVWAPRADRLDVVLLGDEERTLPLQRDERGYHAALHEDIAPGSRYLFRFPDGTRLPDPASRHQPEGVHGPSALFADDFAWSDAAWQPVHLRDYVIYELHIGTFTSEGTFAAAIGKLPYLRDLGITAVELMPVAQFPGKRNWGYDGVFPFAAQESYGGPTGLKQFVDACHDTGLAVILDVVYNHLGPDGNVLGQYAPYFNNTYRTPWGDALNFDGAGSDEVRAYFIQNALQWLVEFHIDALRLDAVHAILDTSAYPFLTELADAVRAESESTGRALFLIAESDLSDPRMLRPRSAGGHGMHAQWLDDYHHALHTLFTGESRGYYADYGSIEHLATTLRRNFVYAGDYSAHRQRRHGAPGDELAPHRFVVCSQNHDQIGNRMLGDRLSTLVPPEALRLAALAVAAGPFTPLLFMGEEYGETAPFPYFVDHQNDELIAAVRKGRREEFAGFSWAGEPPDPQSEATFASAVLDVGCAQDERLRALYKALLALRRALRLGHTDVRGAVHVLADERVLLELRPLAGGGTLALVLGFNPAPVTTALPLPAGDWRVLVDTASPEWGGARTQPFTQLSSDGAFKLALQPWNGLLLTRVDQA